MINASKHPALITRFSLAYQLPFFSSMNHITAGIQNENPETKRADASDRRSEKIGIASAMTHAMMVKMMTRTIQDVQPATVLM